MPIRAAAVYSAIKSELRYPVEFSWLLGLVFFLPMFEAPKNLCWLGYVLTWLYNRVRSGEWGGRWDGWDSLVLAWIASGYLVAAFAGIRYDEWSAANDILRYGAVLWLVKRSSYGERPVMAILGVTVVSTLLTTAWGLWLLVVTRTKLNLELNSVGYFNHSAVYLAIVFGVALSICLAYWARMGSAARAWASLITLALVGSVFSTTSRAAAASAVLVALALVSVFAARRGRGVGRPVAGVIFGAALLVALTPALLKRTQTYAESGQPLSYREKIWSNGLIEWRRFPLFGVGMGNFGQVDFAQLEDWSKTQNWGISPSAERMAIRAPHGHSLYVNTLAERGLVGFGVLFLVLLAWGKSVLARIPRAADSPIQWTVFGGALAGWLVTVTAGVFNTTLHHEHGILSVLLLGLWLGFPGSTAPDRISPLP
jgi:O-antigen ligase